MDASLNQMMWFEQEIIVSGCQSEKFPNNKFWMNYLTTGVGHGWAH